ncbi:Phytoene/squalene synthetase [Salinihabitans flavidus]|uniref:Phytoene/squalene synthetase n=1 Tax=Salinihabitans flavidus TaxID=569882 RepID=A0A1H8PW74_9RHOB|nr:squalene/phytoene synthase family protein [Salinihabitans flavidus]SEO45924.1 Phytoene/squalene synthetase [Salinihabitans flavidus]
MVSDDLSACADLVRRGDPDRFLAVMAAPPDARVRLFPIYAFNLEVARAPWVTQEPLIAEMRLQWWRDALEEIATGGTVRRHEVVTPLSDCLSPDMARTLDTLIEARRWDVHEQSFESEDAFRAYIEATGGTLMLVAGQSLGAQDVDLLSDAGYATGLANWFCAIPELEARGKQPLADGRPEAVQALAREGLARLKRARRGAIERGARPALLAAWQAGAVLTRAAKDPARVAEGKLLSSEFRRRATLLVRVMTGR